MHRITYQLHSMTLRSKPSRLRWQIVCSVPNAHKNQTNHTQNPCFVLWQWICINRAVPFTKLCSYKTHDRAKERYLQTMDLDELQIKMGGMSYYQICLVGLVTILAFGSGLINQSSVFLSAVPDFRWVSICDGLRGRCCLDYTMVWSFTQGQYLLW